MEEARPGYARVCMTLRADLLNGHRRAHGGMISALADSAFAYACNSANTNTVAQQASILFLAPAQEGDTLIADAREAAMVGRCSAYNVEVRVAGGKPIAQFQGLSRSISGSVVEE